MHRGLIHSQLRAGRCLITTDSKEDLNPPLEASTDQAIHELIGSAISDDLGLSPLKGFKLDLSANSGFRKFFFTARCECGTVGLLSVEIAREKTLAEVRLVASELIRRLKGQAETFYGMSCETHKRMRLGAAVT